jgi:hypothetical protein
MATEEKMNVDERFKFLRLMKEQYGDADRKTKSALLDFMEQMTGLHRKYLIAQMNNYGPYRRPRDRQRSRTYGPEVEQAIAIIADTLDWICAERLTPALASTAQHLAKFGELQTSPELIAQLERISISTVRRILKRIGRPADCLPRAYPGRRSDNAAQALIPITMIPWQEAEPGHFEVDLVHHSRSGFDGPFVCTLQFVDVLTGWSERFAILGYEFEVMWRAISRFAALCPIPVREIHSDNGPEFVNLPLISFFGEQLVHIDLTRGRPGAKNDNRFVEQKNSSLVRAYLQDLYLYTPEHARMLDALYEEMRVYYNLFQPVLRQTARWARIDANGVPHILRTQDVAKTPLTRLLMAKPPIPCQRAQSLQAQYDETNPRELKRRIHARLANIYQVAERDERRKACDLW